MRYARSGACRRAAAAQPRSAAPTRLPSAAPAAPRRRARRGPRTRPAGSGSRSQARRSRSRRRAQRPSARTHARLVTCQTASTHHAAQAMCSDGIAASSFACEASAPVCQEPIACVEATTSVKPGSIRGGATGKRQNTMNPSRFTSDERVAQRPVDVGAPPPQPAEQAERDHEVRVVVVVGDHEAERVVPGQPAIERELGIEVQRALHVEHALGVRRARRAGAAARGW